MLAKQLTSNEKNCSLLCNKCEVFNKDSKITNLDCVN